MSNSLKIIIMSLMVSYITMTTLIFADTMENNPFERQSRVYYTDTIQSPQQQVESDPTDRAVGILLDHGITGLVLLILGWWYYKRQQQWDEESASMRKELMDYVKADQQSDYEMMAKIETHKNELKNEMHDLNQKIHELKEEVLYRTFDRRKVPREN